MGRGPIGTRTEPNMKEISKQASATVMENTNMQTAQYTRVTGSMVSAKAKVYSPGLMEFANMRVTGQTT